MLTDEKKISLTYGFVVAARELGAQVVLMEMNSQIGGEPSEMISQALLNADAAILLTSFSFNHTFVRQNVTKVGVRIASSSMMTGEIIKEALDANYDEITETSKKLGKILTNGSEVRIFTELGTDITLYISGRKALWYIDILKTKGVLGNLSTGEAMITPIEDVGGGIYIVDGVLPSVGAVINPVTMVVKNGKIVDLKGKEEIEAFKEFLKNGDENSWKIAEFGTGTNKEAKLMGHPVVDEKVYGTVHLGFGHNVSMVGKQVSKLHYDVIIEKPTVLVDGVCIIDKGVHVY